METTGHHAQSLTHFEIWEVIIAAGWKEKPDPEAAQRTHSAGRHPPAEGARGPGTGT